MNTRFYITIILLLFVSFVNCSYFKKVWSDEKTTVSQKERDTKEDTIPPQGKIIYVPQDTIQKMLEQSDVKKEQPSFVYDLSNENLGDYNTGWINLEGMSDSEKLNTIITIVEDNFKNNRITKSEMRESLNEKWRIEKLGLNDIWFNKFIEYQDAFSKVYEEYIKKYSGIEEKTNMLKLFENEKEVFQEELNRQMLNINLQNTLISIEDERFQTQLAYYPVNILLLGRKPYETFNEHFNSSIQDSIITEVLRKTAVKKVLGFQIYDKEFLKSYLAFGDLIQNFEKTIAKVEEGRTQTGDVFKPAVFIPNPINYSYLIMRIEVYTFSKGKSGEERVQLIDIEDEAADSIEVYEYDSNDKYLTALNVDSRFRLDQLGLQSAESFLNDQASLVIESNRRIDKELRRMVEEHKERLSKHRNEISNISNRRKNILGRISALDDSLRVTGNELEMLKKDFETIKGHYNVTEQTYRDHYMNKTTYIESKQERFLTVELQDNILEDMVMKSFEKKDKLSEQSKRSIVLYSESDIKTGEIIKLSTAEISFVPDITNCKILYMGVDQKFFYMNIAYKINWKSTTTVTGSGRGLSICNYEIMDDIIDGKSYETLFDSTNSISWIVTNPDIFSPGDLSNMEIPSGYRVPTINELYNLDQFLQENEQDLFAQLHWSIDYPYYSSDKKTYEENKVMIQSYDFQNHKIVEIEDYNIVYFIFININK